MKLIAHYFLKHWVFYRWTAVAFFAFLLVALMATSASVPPVPPMVPLAAVEPSVPAEPMMPGTLHPVGSADTVLLPCAAVETEAYARKAVFSGVPAPTSRKC